VCAHGWYLSIPPLLRPKKSAQLPGIAEALQVEDFPSRPNQPWTGLLGPYRLLGFISGPWPMQSCTLLGMMRPNCRAPGGAWPNKAKKLQPLSKLSHKIRVEFRASRQLRDPKALVAYSCMEHNARAGTPYELTPDSRRLSKASAKSRRALNHPRTVLRTAAGELRVEGPSV
jgi:hypothetical protein